LRVAPLLFGDLPELYGVDRWSFGRDRSAPIRATLKLHPGWGLVARDASGPIKGYLVRSASGAVVRIGPFMASSPDIARALISRALKTDGGRSRGILACPGRESSAWSAPRVRLRRLPGSTSHGARRNAPHEGPRGLRHHPVPGYVKQSAYRTRARSCLRKPVQDAGFCSPGATGHSSARSSVKNALSRSLPSSTPTREGPG
jgi:Acetyltransferase (GNAT) domain